MLLRALVLTVYASQMSDEQLKVHANVYAYSRGLVVIYDGYPKVHKDTQGSLL